MTKSIVASVMGTERILYVNGVVVIYTDEAKATQSTVGLEVIPLVDIKSVAIITITPNGTTERFNSVNVNGLCKLSAIPYSQSTVDTVKVIQADLFRKHCELSLVTAAGDSNG